MPLFDTRTIDTTRKGRRGTAGRRTVSYRNVDGGTIDATVISQGTGSGLKLALGSLSGAVVDNVAKATTLKQTNVYFSRSQ